MSESTLSFASSSSFRNSLMGRNLAEYSIQGAYSPPSGPKNFEVILSDSPVIDSPNEYISKDTFSNRLYPLNKYGPESGYNIEINYNNAPLPVDSNQGEYNPNDTNMDLLNEFYIDLAYITNKYGPNDGYNDMVVVTDIQRNSLIYQPYWSPPSFRPSTYTPAEILLSKNPTGSDGPVSLDSYIASFGAKTLQELFQSTIDSINNVNNLGVNQINAFKEPYIASLYSTGQQGVKSLNFHITVAQTAPINQTNTSTALQATSQFVQNVLGQTYPSSPIPGDYFTNTGYKNDQNPQTLLASNAVTNLTGILLGPNLKIGFNPSKVFLDNTGSGQKTVLFTNLQNNRYQPQYDKDLGTQFTVGSNVLQTLAGQGGVGAFLQSGYYVGSPNAEPSMINSPPNQVPVNPYGQQEQAPVYGPSELGILYEGAIPKLGFTFNSKPTIDSGGIMGQFVWTSPRYVGNAGFKATPGGGAGQVAPDFQQISSDFNRNESNQISFRPNSILDKTQRLINSGDLVTGIQRLKHVGNAINQVSKVFNDGYKEITKGSKVVSYVDNSTGSEVGIEYCRVFAKDTPYYTYQDLQRYQGMVNENRRFSYSVLDSTYNLNIAPSKEEYGSTNIVNGKVKKYMFSIENLAWRTSGRPGYTYDDLPYSEKGPNGGRIMWFPPYDLKFNDSSSASFNKTSFLGRPEPIYTYKETTRTGTISWKIIVDQPSILDLITSYQLKNTSKERVDSILDSFFAGCAKYDIYELAKKFNTLKLSELVSLQELLNSPNLTETEITQINDEIPKENVVVPKTSTITTEDKKVPVNTEITGLKQTFDEYAFYFEQDTPKSVENFKNLYDNYVTTQNIETYQKNANSLFTSGSPNSLTTTFFDNIIKQNFTKISEGANSYIEKIKKILNDNQGTITIDLQGSANWSGTDDYNKKLAERRINSVIEWFKSTGLEKYITDKKLLFKSIIEGEGSIIPKGELGAGGTITCTEEVKDKNGNLVRKYSVDTIACRRVKITTTFNPSSTADQTKDKTPKTTETTTTTTTTTTNQTSGQVSTSNQISSKIVTTKPKNTEDIKAKLRKGLGKKIIRKLLTEGDYFQVLQKENPFIYDSLKEKLKYFNPIFHSMTPEGLNSRLTFLNQCVRPGDTIPVIGPDNTIRNDNALNTSFGTPPILVLRIGDFYNTKIVPNNLQISYDPLVYDMNPEGIGLQPMIANISLSFDFIGGHGLANPVEQLQNALSFNFYANTEVYDERATETDFSLTKLDKELFDSLLQGEEGVNENDAVPSKTNNGGDTIGTILTTDNVTGGQTGTTSFQSIMDGLLNDSKQYFTTIFNQLDKIQQISNYGIVQMVTKKRKYEKGKINNYDGQIFGKPDDLNTEFQSLFKLCVQNVNNGTNPIISKLKNDYPSITDNDIREIKKNMVSYLNNLSSSFPNEIQIPIQEMVNVQTNLIQTIRKINLVCDKTDGKILNTGVASVYNLSPTADVSKGSTFISTYYELISDYNRLYLSSKQYILDMVNAEIIRETSPGNPAYKGTGNAGLLLTSYFPSEDVNSISFYMVMARILTNNNKKDSFISSIIKGPLNDVKKLKSRFTSVVNNLASNYIDELQLEEKLFAKFKTSKTYNQYFEGIEQTLYVKGKTRKFEYTTIPSGNNTQQKQKILDLYKTSNVDPNENTFTNKITLN